MGERLASTLGGKINKTSNWKRAGILWVPEYRDPSTVDVQDTYGCLFIETHLWCVFRALMGVCT